MSNAIYDKLVDYAYSLVNIASKNYLKGKGMYYFALILGKGNWIVESRPGAGHNYQAIMDAIHLYYADHPKSRINEGFEEELSLLCQAVGNMVCVQLVLNFIIYELKKEKEGSNSFKFNDCQVLLNKVRQSIKEEHENLKSEYPDIDKYVEDTNLFLEKNYGYSF